KAVGELHAAMQVLLEALDEGEQAIAAALGALRQDRGRIERALGTVTALTRPPADPFHERLVACYPQLRRFLPTLIEAITFECTDAARPVLDAYQACDEDRYRILNVGGQFDRAQGTKATRGCAAGGLVAPLEVDRGVAGGGRA
ncbi:Transposase, Tn3, partial [mine drainage metagenome]